MAMLATLFGCRPVSLLLPPACSVVVRLRLLATVKRSVIVIEELFTDFFGEAAAGNVQMS